MEKLKETYGDFTVNTRTQKEYNNLMKLFEDNDIGWNSDEKATDNDLWRKHKQNTCVTVAYDGYLAWGNIESFLEWDSVILSLNTFIQESGLEFKKEITMSQIEEKLGYKIKIISE